MNTIAAAFHIHTITKLVYTQAQATTNFLSLGSLAVRMLQCANLEYIRVIPTFTQRRVGEDKACRFLKGKQTLFILQNQIISGNIVGELASTLQLAVNTSTSLFINRKIALMHCTYITAGGFQIFLIRSVKNSDVIIQHIQIFLFKHLSVFSKDFISIRIILTILGNFVDKEKREGFDTHVEQFFFFLEVGKNGLSNLNPTHIRFRHITRDFTGFDYFSIGKGHCATERINIRDGVSLVLFHFLRNIVEVISYTEDTGLTVDRLVVSNFKLDPSHRRFFR